MKLAPMPFLCLNSSRQEPKRANSNSQNWLIFLGLVGWFRLASLLRLRS